MKKVIVIETTEREEDLLARIQNSLIDEKEKIETVQDYPFTSRFRADYLDMYNEVLIKLEMDFEETTLDAHVIVDIADSIAEEFSNYDDINEIRNELIDDAIYKQLNKDI